MTDTEIAAIIFNETRSLSGEKIFDAGVNVAHAVVNGEKSGKRAKSSPTKAIIPNVENLHIKAASVRFRRCGIMSARTPIQRTARLISILEKMIGRVLSSAKKSKRKSDI